VSNQRLSLIVGSFVILCLGGLAVAILTLTSESGLFVQRYRLVAPFSNVQGLLPGAPVWLSGMAVGRVQSVTFNPLGGEASLAVILSVDKEVQELIRQDSLATIGTIGVLGDSYVEVSIGTLETPELSDGAVINTQSPLNLMSMVGKAADLMETGGVALASIGELAENVNSVVGDFSGEGGAVKAADAIGAVSDIVLAVQEGPGLMHSIVYDRYEGGGVESIERSLATLEDIFDEIANGQGILHTLIFESPDDQDLIMEALEAGARLNSILAKVDRGEGSFGLFLNDPTVYEDVKMLLGGAQRSAVLRRLIRMAAGS
jgi:phospholipid/cholesterol/gamma-HCH transport system substrate-binding protein